MKAGVGLLTAKELARTLGLSLGTVYKMVRDGKIAAIRVGTGRSLRFDPEAVTRTLSGEAPPPRPREWSEADPLLTIHELAVETGLKDLAEHHDHYLYGIPGR